MEVFLNFKIYACVLRHFFFFYPVFLLDLVKN